MAKVFAFHILLRSISEANILSICLWQSFNHIFLVSEYLCLVDRTSVSLSRVYRYQSERYLQQRHNELK